ncbi:hypothetical protein E2C01_060598 [Portunus trituberculatus]|uniref:Secreted protein n=1 Tax=Portunus trituberculatus TaxID=210409 RepID=A0A5B7H2X4_PORTR|nr:hypothetical protein [Portunus trituberculatus]
MHSSVSIFLLFSSFFSSRARFSIYHRPLRTVFWSGTAHRLATQRRYCSASTQA